jgi:hypothetical protein
MDDRDDPLSDVVHRQLVVAGAQGTTLLEPAHYAFDNVPSAIVRPVEILVARLVCTRRDDILDVMPPQPTAYPWIAVSFVPGQTARPAFPTRQPGSPRSQHDGLEGLGLVALPRCHEHGQDDAMAVTNQVNLSAVTTSRTPQRMVKRFHHLRLLGPAQVWSRVWIFFSPRRLLGWRG